MKEFDLDKMMKEAGRRAREWKQRIEEKLKTKLEDEILDDYDLTIERISCIGEREREEREKIKQSIQ